jgi:hypothetical protein
MRRFLLVSMSLSLLVPFAFVPALAQGQAVEMISLGESFAPGSSVQARMIVENRSTKKVTYCAPVLGGEGCQWFVTLSDFNGKLVYQSPPIPCLRAIDTIPLDPYESILIPVSAPVPGGAPPGVYALQVRTDYFLGTTSGACSFGVDNTPLARIPVRVR